MRDQSDPRPAGVPPPPARAEQGATPSSAGIAYWDGNLDAGNLGREEAAVDWERERAFFLAAPEVRWALAQLEPLGGGTIVDLGTGLGVAAIEFARRGARCVLAVDPAPRRLERAGELARRLGVEARWRGVAATAEALPFEDASVDRVFTRSVLIHTDLVRAVAEMRRVLRPGGRAVLVEPMDRNPFVRAYRATLAPSEWQGITRYFTEERVAAVRAAGWARTEERRFHLVGFGAYVFQFALRWPLGMRTALAIARPLDAALFAVAPAARRWAWFSVLVLEK